MQVHNFYIYGGATNKEGISISFESNAENKAIVEMSWDMAKLLQSEILNHITKRNEHVARQNRLSEFKRYVKGEIDADRRVNAIKEIRNFFGCGLAEAAAIVDLLVEAKKS